MILHNVLAVALLYACVNASRAADVACGPTATGNGSGSDWDNIADFDNFTYGSTNPTRGNTYWIKDSDGTNYAGNQLATMESGSTFITIKKATPSAHGPSTGWVDSMGDGQAIFGGVYVFTNNWVIDGVTGGGPGSWTSGHGFLFYNFEANPTWNPVHVSSEGWGDNITLKHVEIKSNLTPDITDAISTIGGDNWLISHCYTWNTDNCSMNLAGATNVVIEYNYFYTFTSSVEHHAEICFHYGSGPVTYRYNLFRWVESTGGLMIFNSPAQVPILVYGNVFYRAASENWAYGVDGVVGTWTNRSDLSVYDLKVYNNTFINVPSGSIGLIGTTPNSGLEAKNNYFYNSGTGLPNGIWSHDYNHFQDCLDATAANETEGTGDPFVDFVNLNFALQSNTAAGTNLGSPYNVDMLGNTRSTWTRGAIEFSGGPAWSVGTMQTDTLTINPP